MFILSYCTFLILVNVYFCCDRFSLIFQIAKQMVKERQDIIGPNCLKGLSGKVIVDEKGIKGL